MTERRVIEDKLRKKQAEVQSLELKLQAAKVYVTALQDVLKLLNADAAESSEAKLKAGSATAQARDVILEHGEPLHIDELLRDLGKEITRETRASLNSSLAAYARKNEIFVRTAPNTYGLFELGHDLIHEKQEDDEPQPPSGFGGFNIPDDLPDDVPF